MLTRGEMQGYLGQHATLEWFEKVLDRFVRSELPSCALDVAESPGGITLEEVGAILGLTRERVRQIEKRGQAKIAEEHPELFELLLSVPEPTEHPMETLESA